MLDRTSTPLAAALVLLLAACGQSQTESPQPAGEPGGTYEPTPVPEETGAEETGTIEADADHEDHADHEDGDEDHDHGHAGEAHVHGHAEMSFVREGGTLTVSMLSPMHNLAGFEHPPRDDEEQATLDGVKTTMLDPAAVFDIPASAGCELTSTDYILNMNSDGGPEDLDMTWEFTCTGEGDWKIGLNLFDLYPNLLDVDALVLSGATQSGEELSPTETSLDIPG